MSLASLVLCALATWQIVEIWQHGSILATYRLTAETWDNFWGWLLQCPWCLSVWVAAGCGAWVLLVEGLGASPVWLWPLYALAISRLANLGNDLAYEWTRTPKITARTPTDEDIHDFQESDRGATDRLPGG